MAGYVFVSYSRSDSEYVHRLVEFLRAAGIEVWTDDGIDHGDRWAATVQVHVDGCAAVVPVMTPAAETSTWVEREIARAEEMGKPSLPLLLAGKTFFRLGNVQYEDVSGGRLPSPRYLDRLRTVVGAPAPAPAAPAPPPVPAAPIPPVPVAPIPPVPAAPVPVPATNPYASVGYQAGVVIPAPPGYAPPTAPPGAPPPGVGWPAPPPPKKKRTGLAVGIVVVVVLVAGGAIAATQLLGKQSLADCIIGTWRIDSITIRDLDTGAEDTQTPDPEIDLEFYADGTGTYHEGDSTGSGQYSLDGDEITTQNDGGGGDTAHVDCDGDDLTFTFTNVNTDGQAAEITQRMHRV